MFNNKLVENFGIIFPLWVPFSFFILIKSFPDFEPFIFILYIFLLAETHFATTWIFFFDKKNIFWSLKNKFYTIYLPIFLVTLILLIFFLYGSNYVFLFTAIFSGIHVTRQSAGINKIYSPSKSFYNIGNLLIYFCCILFLFYGFLNFFYIPSSFSLFQHINFNLVTFRNIIIILYAILSLSFAFYVFYKKLNFNYFLTYLTGTLIYLTYLFVTRIEHAIIIGVGMHYSQYLGINFILYKNKFKNLSNKLSLTFFTLLFIFTYAFIMIIFRTNEHGLNSYEWSYLFIIPMMGHNLHFYIDAFIWKFSNPYIRENIGKVLFAK